MPDTSVDLTPSHHGVEPVVPSPIEPLSDCTLYVVATPIGNLRDISYRALAVLRQVDAILAEDTRHSKKLFAHYGIKPNGLYAMHQHNEAGLAVQWCERIRHGERVALITDAGTPLVSDPGFSLVKCCVEAGVAVCVVPGPCAFIAALSASGLPCHDFRFVGFLPAKSVARREKLTAFLTVTSTVGFYEAPHRLGATLEDMLAVFGETRPCVLAHDMTKRFESYIRGNVLACVRWVRENTPRGEWVILIGPPENSSNTSLIDPAWPEGVSRLLLALRTHLPPKAVAAVVAEHYGVSKKTCYQWLIDNA